MLSFLWLSSDNHSGRGTRGDVLAGRLSPVSRIHPRLQQLLRRAEILGTVFFLFSISVVFIQRLPVSGGDLAVSQRRCLQRSLWNPQHQLRVWVAGGVSWAQRSSLQPDRVLERSWINEERCFSPRFAPSFSRFPPSFTASCLLF